MEWAGCSVQGWRGERARYGPHQMVRRPVPHPLIPLQELPLTMPDAPLQSKVLELLFEGGKLEIGKTTDVWRYRLHGELAKANALGQFQGVRIFGRTGVPLLECAGDEAFYMSYGLSPLPEFDLTPPPDAKPVKQLGEDAKFLGKGVEEFNIWLRIPNFLLPIFHRLRGEPDEIKDGHYSWLTVNMRHRWNGHAVWSLGFAAGGDTGNVLWFKDAKWTEALASGEDTAEGNLLGKGKGDAVFKEVDASFRSIARHFTIPAPLPDSSPRSVLISMCERMLGVSARLNPREYKAPMSCLQVSWEWEPVDNEETRARVGRDSKNVTPRVRRLVLRRAFMRTSIAAEAMYRLEVGERKPGQKESEKIPRYFNLVQKSRPLTEANRRQKRLHRRWWYVQPSLKPPGEPDLPKKVEEAPYLKELAAMFSRHWSGLIRSLRPNLEDERTVLFDFTPDTSKLAESKPPVLKDGRLEWSLDVWNPLPQFDLVVNESVIATDGPYLDAPTDMSLSFRVEPRPPELGLWRQKKDVAVTINGMLTWPALRTHDDREALTLEGAITLEAGKSNGPEKGEDPLGDSPFSDEEAKQNFTSWMVRWKAVVGAGSGGKSGPGMTTRTLPVRAGSLDLQFDKARLRSNDKAASCTFYFRHAVGYLERWGAVEPLRLAFYALGWSDDVTIDSVGQEDGLFLKGRPWFPQPDNGVRLPLADVRPGETDHHEAETELFTAEGGPLVSSERPLVVNLADAQGGALDDSDKWLLETQEIGGTTFTHRLDMRIRPVDQRRQREPEGLGRLRTLYLDRTPFFVGLVQMHDIREFPREEGSEAAYFSTKGLFRGWQLRASRFEFRLHFPPQGIGEAMEKGKSGDGYHDIEEGSTVDFRFPPISTLTLKSSDFERRYGPVPWNLRLALNSLKENRLVGLPLKAAEFEMLYGLRMKIAEGEQTRYLRLAELLARLGWPRRLMLLTPANKEYWDSPEIPIDGDSDSRSEAGKAYGEARHLWRQLLEAVNSRLAVYEVFDDRQVEFDRLGEPMGLLLEGDRADRSLTAELRKSASLRVSMPAVMGGESSPVLSNKEEFKKLPGERLKTELEKARQGNVTSDWWRKLIPNYDDGLAGSFAWAFESRLLYESLWASDPDPSTLAVVEAVEATLARLYFSALGGWSNQRAAFANGKIVVVVNVEMGRVSELRVEVIGRIGILWNKAKLVTVFRRSVLPSDQFQDQQDLHAGRPMLRKVEEYVEFLEKYRLAHDTTNPLNAGGGADVAGCFKASSCEERILVDARWGTDVYDANGNGIGFKLPLRKPGINQRIYGPANVLLHFHADGAGPSNEIGGRIENLEDLVFWTDVRLDQTADTNTWPTITLIDIFPAERTDGANPEALAWASDKDVADWKATMIWGTPPVAGESAACTFRVAGLVREASVNRHLQEAGVAPAEQRPVGSLLRNVTLSRGFTAEMGGPAEKASAGLRAAGEHLMSFLEQVATRSTEAGERVYGWEALAKAALQKIAGGTAISAEELEKLMEDLHPVVNAQANMARGFDELGRRAGQELSHLKFFTEPVEKPKEETPGELVKILKEKLAGLTGVPDVTTISRVLRDFREMSLGKAAPGAAKSLGLELNAKLNDARDVLEKMLKAAEAFRVAVGYAKDSGKLSKEAVKSIPKILVGTEKELADLVSAMNQAITDVVDRRGVGDAKAEQFKTGLEEVLSHRLGWLVRRKLEDVASTLKGGQTWAALIDKALINAHLEEVLRHRLGWLFRRRLEEIASILKGVQTWTEKIDKEVMARLNPLVKACFVDASTEGGEDFARKLANLWKNAVSNNVQVEHYLQATAEMVARAFSKGGGGDDIPPILPKLLFIDELHAIASAVEARAEAMRKLLEEGAKLHARLESILRRGVPDLAIECFSKGSFDVKKFDAGIEKMLLKHVHERLAALDSTLGQVGDSLFKQGGALEQLKRVLRNSPPLKDKIGEVEKFFAMGDAEVKKWIAEADRVKETTWNDLKKTMSAAEKSPVHKVVKKLKEIQEGLSKSAEDHVQKARARLEGNLEQLMLRGDRELRSIPDQMRTYLGRFEVMSGDVKMRITRFRESWLGDKSDQLTRALQNIAGTREHALNALGKAGKSLEALGTALEALGTVLAEIEAVLAKLQGQPDEPVKTKVLEQATEMAKTKLRPLLNFAIRAAESVVRDLSLPWWHRLPTIFQPDAVLGSLRQTADDLEWVTKDTVQHFVGQLKAAHRWAKGEQDKIKAAAGTLKKHLDGIDGKLQIITAQTRKTVDDLIKKLSEALPESVAAINKEVHEIFVTAQDLIEKDIATGVERTAKIFEDTSLFKNLLKAPSEVFDRALRGLGVEPADLQNDLQEAARKFTVRLPDLSSLERGVTEMQGWMDRQRESLALAMDQVRGVQELAHTVQEAKAEALETFRAFGRAPKVPGLNFTEMATLDKLKDFQGDAKSYLANINSRLGSVSYAFNHAAKAVEERLRMTPVKGMVDRLKNAGNEVVEEARLRAATVETAVRNLGKKVEADARRMIDNLKPSIKDLLPDFGGLKLEKLLAASGLSDRLIQDFQRKLVTRHGMDPQTKTAFVDSRVDDLVLDDALTVFSFGPMTLRLRNVKMFAHLRIETGIGKETRRQSNGKLVADWEVLVGGTALITYVQAALENKDGQTKMQLDPKKVRMPSILQTVADVMKGYNSSGKEGSGLRAGVLTNLPTDITGFVKYNLDIPSAGAGTSGIQNLRIALFFELGLRFPRFPSLKDASLRISAGVGLSDREAPFIIAIWILGGCGWFQLRLDYVVPFTDGKPHLEVTLSVGLGVSASLAFDCGFASGSVYVALAVEIECRVARGRTFNQFSIVLTMAGNLSLLGIITVHLLIMLSISYTSPGPMVGTGLIRVKIKICWCFTLKIERSFTKTFGGGGAQGYRAPTDPVRNIEAASPLNRMPEMPRSAVAQREPVAAPTAAPQQRPAPAGAHRKAARMIV